MTTNSPEDPRANARKLWFRAVASTSVGVLLLCAFVGNSSLHGPRAAGSSFYGTNRPDLLSTLPLAPGGPTHWTPAAPSPTPRIEGYACSYGNKLFTFGGYKSLIHPYAINTDASVYDPAADTWTSLGSIPIPPTHAGMARDLDHGMLYFVGGLQGAYPGVTTTQVWSYDLANNAWSPMPPLPVPLAAGSAVFVANELHYFAGIGAHDRNTNVPVHYVLPLDDTTWHTAAPLPTPRDHLTALALDGKIYAFGGEIGHDARHLQQTLSHVYDPATDTWTRLPDMPRSKSHTEASAFVHDGKIVIAGGQIDQYASTDTILQFDPTSNSWAFLGRLPAALQGAVLQPVGPRIILTQGYDGTHMNSQTWTSNLPTAASPSD